MRTLRLVCFVLGATAITVPAAADDVSPLSPSPIAAPITNWSGFYLGGHLGGGFGTSGDLSRTQTATFIVRAFFLGGGTDTSGFLGGGQFGYNYQLGNFVIGAEANLSGADIRGSGGTVLISTAPAGGHVSANTDLITDVTGRLGYAVGPWLYYAKGGAAWSHNAYDLVTSTGVDWHWDGTRTGWIAGGGIEWAFRPEWSAKVEYQYYDLGGSGHLTNPAGETAVGTYTQFVHAFTVGLNYHF